MQPHSSHHSRSQQKGVFLILYAILMPLIIACTGVAIDLGNAYLHRSALQNSADAAALGGARAGVRKGAWDQSAADNVANDLIAKNQPYPYKQPPDLRYQASKSKPQVSYYVVTLQEKLPMIFLKYFGPKFQEMNISARAIASIEQQTVEQSRFPYLLFFKNHLDSTNTMDQDKVIKTFDGDIVYTDKNPEIMYHNATLPNGAPVTCFYDSKNNENHPRYENASLHDKELDAMIAKETNPSTRDASVKFFDQNQQNISSRDISQGDAFVFEGNVTLTINAALSNASQSPIYIYLYGGSVCNIHLDADNQRPIVICRINQKTSWGGTTGGGSVHFEGGGGQHTFNGVIYMPDSDDFHINEGGMTFNGSIVARKISLNSGAKFIHKDWISQGNASTGGSSSSPIIRLCNEID